MNTEKKIAVIGGGVAGLSAACKLGKAGFDVHLFEKNNQLGGRASILSTKDYMFDLGPSWYWMPDVFERFFNEFNYTTSDFYELKKLSPGFKMIFDNDEINVSGDFEKLCQNFEKIEKGAGEQLRAFIENAKIKYDISLDEFVHTPSLSIREFIHWNVIKGAIKLDIFTPFDKFIKKYFKDERLLTLMKFPILFLGAIPKNTPSLYSLMNYSGLRVGTYYPMGGFSKIPAAMEEIAREYGVQIHLNHNVEHIHVQNREATSITVNGSTVNCAAIVGAADYAHIDQMLLDKPSYSKKYWETRTYAPAALIFYLGINTRIPRLIHHNLFFEHLLDEHATEIYHTRQWPEKPLFYTCCPTKTDDGLAPKGHDILYLLMPIAIGLEDTEERRQHYYDILLNRLERYTDFPIRKHIVHKTSYCIKDFIQDYNAYEGNAYGLANTIRQTAIFKPKMKHKHIKNLVFAGQLTVPGPGLPPSIISGQIAATVLTKELK